MPAMVQKGAIRLARSYTAEVPEVLHTGPLDEPSESQEERLAEAILEAFATALSGAALSADARRELVVEARPAVHAVLFAVGSDRAGDTNSLEHHESLAMLTLLGRKVALLGGTPSAALCVVPALCDAFESCEVRVPAGVNAALNSVLMEGFVRGREEAVDERHRRSLAKATGALRVCEGVLLLRFVGRLDPDAIVAVGEDFARRLFSTEAVSCVVDVSSLEGTTSRHARAVFAIDEAARMLGVRCIFSGFDERWAETLADVDPRDAEGSRRLLVERVEPFADALHTALSAADYRLQRGSWLPASIRSLLS